MRPAKTLLTALLTAAAPPTNGAEDVSAFHCKTPQQVDHANVRDVYAAYGARSVAIIRSALAGDTVGLSKIVAPTATFEVFEGDVGMGPRSAGAGAAVEFAKQIAPRSFQYSAGSAGPVSLDPCGSATAELTLIGNQSDEAVIATFKYRNGFLTEVQASRVHLVRGDLQTISTR